MRSSRNSIQIPTTAAVAAEPTQYKLQYTLEANISPISSVHYSPDASDNTICLWSAHDGRFVRNFTGHEKGVSDACWRADSKAFASGSDDCFVFLWSVDDDRPEKKLAGHKGSVSVVHFNSMGTLVASGSLDETVRIWDIKTGVTLKVLPAHADSVSSLSFNPDGTLLVSGAFDGLIRLWDTATGQCLKTIVNGKPMYPRSNSRSFTTFSSNGKYVLAGSLDYYIRLYSYTTGECLKMYYTPGSRGSSKYCCRATFDSQQKYIVGGSDDGAVYIWDLQSRTVLQKLIGHEGVVLDVSCHPTRNVIATCGLDSTVKIWESNSSPSLDLRPL